MNITLIGAGRLAEQLGLALCSAGHTVNCVYSRTRAHAEALAAMLGATPTDDLTATPADSDAYVVAVKDGAIAEVARRLCPGREQALFVHTAGGVSKDVFAGLAPRHGVLYPMQTFTHGRAVDFAEIACFVEGSTPEVQHDIAALASTVSRRVATLDSEGRRRLHVAAVFACNFVNHCYALAADVLAEGGIPFDTMLPLIDETASKVHAIAPDEAQTGPAVRGDKGVMDAHLALIDNKTMAEIYRLMSRSIHAKAIESDAEKTI